MVYLTPTLVLVVLLSIVNSFKIFREIYMLAGDYPYDTIYMLQHYMNNMFLSLDIQKMTAAAVVMVAFMLLLVSGLFRFEKWFRSFTE